MWKQVMISAPKDGVLDVSVSGEHDPYSPDRDTPPRAA